MARTLCIDFDGVLHSYKSEWKGARVIPDPPVPGALKWLQDLLFDPSFEVCIYSGRSRQWGGRRAMRKWLKIHGLDPLVIPLIKFPVKKPKAFLTIDDRAICFKGEFPSIKELKAFRPWHRKGKK
jgi:hypothetical protein